VLGVDGRRVGRALLDAREDLDALDRVDPEVRLEVHVELDHVERVARLLRDDLEEDALEAARVEGPGRLGLAVRRDRRDRRDGRDGRDGRGARGRPGERDRHRRCHGRGRIRRGPTPALPRSGGRGFGATGIGADGARPRARSISRCCPSSRLWNVWCAVSCPSRNRR